MEQQLKRNSRQSKYGEETSARRRKTNEDTRRLQEGEQGHIKGT
jgi:hypothetical protein